jgi:hypothetical protein
MSYDFLSPISSGREYGAKVGEQGAGSRTQTFPTAGQAGPTGIEPQAN